MNPVTLIRPSVAPLRLLKDQVTIQIADDVADRNLIPPQHFTGDLRDDRFVKRLIEWNQKGAAVWFSINATNGEGRTKKDVTSIRAWFVDIDHLSDPDSKDARLRELLEDDLAPPSAVVESRNGLHVYWYAPPEGEPVDESRYKTIALRLAERHQADPSVAMLTALGRVPGLLHQKDPNNPFPVTVRFEEAERVYTSTQLLDRLPPTRKEAAVTRPAPGTTLSARKRLSYQGTTPYGRSALERAAMTTRSAPRGTRNTTFNREMYGIAQLIGGGEVDEHEGIAVMLESANATGMEEPRIRATLQSALRAGKAAPRAAPVPVTMPTEKRASDDTLRKHARALKLNDDALGWLIDVNGLAMATIERYDLGLTIYRGKKANAVHDALTYPLRDIDGNALSRLGRVAIPGVTQGASATHWTPGEASTYWAHTPSTATDVLIVANPLEAWRILQEITDNSLGDRLAVICSSTAHEIPEPWKAKVGPYGSTSMFDAFEHIYLGMPSTPASERFAQDIVSALRTDTYRLAPPNPDTSWVEWFQEQAGTAEQLAVLIEAAPKTDFATDVQRVEAYADDPNATEFQPVRISVANAFAKGRDSTPYLYYPYSVGRRGIERLEDGTQIDTVHEVTYVLRSDGQRLTWDYLPAPKGTPKSRRFLALSDGTLIWRSPSTSRWATWSLDGINRFIAAKAKGGSAATMPFHQVIDQMYAYLRSVVLLPRDCDYSVLILATLVSYVQHMFDAVGYVHLRGPGGTGKSQVLTALLNLGCNAHMISGETSGVTIVRALDERGGLAVFDDLESIGKHGRRGGEDSAFSTIKQVIKVGYKKSTAVRMVTNVNADNAVEELNFFGMKIISSTSEADSLVEARTYIIPTRKAPAGYNLPPAPHDLDLTRLRDELHIWAFENVETLNAAIEADPPPTDRFAEITRPMRILCSVIDHPTLTADFHAAVRAQQVHVEDSEENAEGIVRDALTNLVAQGYTKEVQSTHLAFEAATLAGPSWGKARTTDVAPWEDMQRLGSMLKVNGWVEAGKDRRPRFLGGDQPRLYRPTEEFVAGVMELLRARGEPLPTEVREAASFCLDIQNCNECPFVSICTYQETKTRYISKARRFRGGSK